MLGSVPFGRYYEPFAGGAALFFALSPKRATLSDSNSDLMNFYRVVKLNAVGLIREICRLKNSETEYYKVRDWQPRLDVRRAARFYYLTRLAFNGIYRENLSGIFNVPYGYKKHLPICDPDQILRAQRALRRTALQCGDFRDVVKGAVANDLIYFDPPYTVSHNNNGFIKYNRRLFTWQDQLDLATLAEALRGKGCHVIVSNADHDDVTRLYRGFQQVVVPRFSVISATVEGRALTTERLILSPPLAAEYSGA